MNANSCIASGEWGDVESWPDGDPRRQHLSNCARCQAELMSYREFLQTGDRPAGARPQEAATVLRAALRREWSAQRHAAPRRRGTPRRWQLWAVAAVAALVLVAVRVPWRNGESLGPLRSGRTGQLSDAIELSAVQWVGAELELAWSGVVDADRYTVSIFDPQLRQLGRIDAGAQTNLRLRLDQLDRQPNPAEPLAWQVEAHRQGARIASSPLATFTQPTH